MNPSATDAKAVMGVDIGSITAKAVILSHNDIISWVIIPSGGNTGAVANDVIKQVLRKAGLINKDIGFTMLPVTERLMLFQLTNQSAIFLATAEESHIFFPQSERWSISAVNLVGLLKLTAKDTYSRSFSVKNAQLVTVVYCR